MSKRLFVGFIITLLIIIFIGSVVTGVYLFTRINMNTIITTKSANDKKYHVVVIVDGYHSSYSTQFKQGLDRASLEYNIGLEYWDIRTNNVMEDCLKQLDIAIISKVDGIIIHAFNNEKFVAAIDKAEEAGIPVVLLNEDVPSSKRLTYVGINRYNIGVKVAELFQANIPDKGNIALIEKNIYGNNANNGTENNVDLLVMGIREALNKSGNLELSQVKYTDIGLLSAESITTEIINDEKAIKGIFCADGQDTLGVLQVLTDFNRLNDVVIIGFDDLPEIIAYIEKGLIKASVVADYEMIGYKSLKAMVDQFEGKTVSSYIMTDIKILQKEDLPSVTDNVNEN